jgi:hypothetical protein
LQESQIAAIGKRSNVVRTSIRLWQCLLDLGFEDLLRLASMICW